MPGGERRSEKIKGWGVGLKAQLGIWLEFLEALAQGRRQDNDHFTLPPSKLLQPRGNERMQSGWLPFLAGSVTM